MLYSLEYTFASKHVWFSHVWTVWFTLRAVYCHCSTNRMVKFLIQCLWILHWCLCTLPSSFGGNLDIGAQWILLMTEVKKSIFHCSISACYQLINPTIDHHISLMPFTYLCYMISWILYLLGMLGMGSINLYFSWDVPC